MQLTSAVGNWWETFRGRLFIFLRLSLPLLPPTFHREHVMCKSWERRNRQESRVSKKAAVSSVKRCRLTRKPDQTLTLRLPLQRLPKLKLHISTFSSIRWVLKTTSGDEGGLSGCHDDPADVRALITSHQRLRWRWWGDGGGGRGTLKVTGDTPAQPRVPAHVPHVCEEPATAQIDGTGRETKEMTLVEQPPVKKSGAFTAPESAVSLR